MTAPQTDEFVIIGLTLEGRPFRPSDWAERLAGVMAQFGGDPPFRYSPYCQPTVSEGVKCVVVDARLKAIEPAAHRFLVSFANDNELQVRPGRKTARSWDEAGPGDAPRAPGDDRK
ncbi:MAG: DUF3579 domain-containing protein [Burkholderiales bacterium]|nr:DUF3579 domain-containing protein [Burkholderiales bacterium]